MNKSLGSNSPSKPTEDDSFQGSQNNGNSSDDPEGNSKYNSGRWTEEEHKKFIDGILEYGNEWKKVQKFIKTRSSTQARSHAQKFFLKIKKNLTNFKNNSPDNFSIKYFYELLASLDKEKNGKLTGPQRDKLFNILSKYSFSEYEYPENRQNTGLDLVFNSNDKINSNRNNVSEVQQIEGINQNDDNLTYEVNKLANKIHCNKIFDIKKDRTRRDSINSCFNFGYSNQIKIKKKNILNITKSKSEFMNNALNSNISGADLSTGSLSPNTKEFSDNKVYEAMKEYFVKKRKIEGKEERFFSRPRYYSSSFDPFNESKKLFENPEFFPNQIMNERNDYQQKKVSNPFSISFNENSNNIGSLSNQNDNFTCLDDNYLSQFLEYEPFNLVE